LKVKLCDPCLSALKWFVYHVRRYTGALLYRITTVVYCAFKDTTHLSVTSHVHFTPPTPTTKDKSVVYIYVQHKSAVSLTA